MATALWRPLVGTLFLVLVVSQHDDCNHRRETRVRGSHVSRGSRASRAFRALAPPMYEGCVDIDLTQAPAWYLYTDDRMYIGLCWSACEEKFYKYAALYASNHCYCGSTINPPSVTFVHPRECSSPCSGLPEQNCGGPTAFALYTLR